MRAQEAEKIGTKHLSRFDLVVDDQADLRGGRVNAQLLEERNTFLLQFRGGRERRDEHYQANKRETRPLL